MRRLAPATATATATACLLLASCTSEPAALTRSPGAGLDRSATQRVTLRDDLGDYHRKVTSTSPEAQRLFDQGLVLLYGTPIAPCEPCAARCRSRTAWATSSPPSG